MRGPDDPHPINPATRRVSLVFREEDHLSKWELPPNLKKKWGVQWLPTGENMKETLLALQHARNGCTTPCTSTWNLPCAGHTFGS
jgi:hypothetical protein